MGQSQNDPDIQIGKDMIIHPDFMTSSQPVSFCAPKVWYLVEMLLKKRVAWCPLDLTRQAVVAASPSLKQAGVARSIHHLDASFWENLDSGNWGCVFSHTFRSVDRVSCLFWLYYRQSIRTEQKALSLFWHGWSVQKAMFFLWMQGAL